MRRRDQISGCGDSQASAAPLRPGAPGRPARVAAGAALVVAAVSFIAFTGAPLALAVAGCARYASPEGSDAQPGTLREPLETVGALVASLAPGERGCLLAGTYTEDVKIENSGTSATPITLSPAPGATATLIGRLWVSETASDVVIEHLNLDGRNSTNLPSPTVNGDRISFIGNDVTNHNTGICFNLGHSSWGVADDTVIDGNRIHDCGRLPATNHDHGIYVAVANGTRIINNLIYDNADRGVQLYPNAQGTVVANNVIDANGVGIIFSGANGTASSDTLVVDNIITNSLIRQNVEAWYPEGNPIGSNNLVEHNCIWNGATGNIGNQIGFTARDNLVADPSFVDRVTFALAPGSPCVGMGPRNDTVVAQTPPSFRSSSSSIVSWNTQWAVNRPVGVEEGDLLLACVSTRKRVPASAPADWTLVREDASSQGVGVAAAQRVYVKQAGASEPSSYTFTAPEPVSGATIVAAYTGVDPVSPVIAASGDYRFQPGSAYARAPGLTVEEQGVLLVGCYGHNGRRGAFPPTGASERADRWSSVYSTLWLGLELSDEELAGTASPGSPIATGERAALDEALMNYAYTIGQLVALRPATPDAPPGTTILVTDSEWRCTQPLATYGVLPITVISDVPNTIGSFDAVHLGSGCTGDGDPDTIDLILDVRGDGADRGVQADALKIGGGAHDIQITGRVDCGRKGDGVHQDVVQVMWASRITFSHLVSGDVADGTYTCGGAGGALFLARGNAGMGPVEDIVCDGCAMATWNQGLHIGESVRSGARNSTFVTWAASPYRVSTDAVDPVNLNNIFRKLA